MPELSVTGLCSDEYFTAPDGATRRAAHGDIRRADDEAHASAPLRFYVVAGGLPPGSPDAVADNPVLGIGVKCDERLSENWKSVHGFAYAPKEGAA